jgi:molybdopterin-containing oxidoreductase family membrane subunit
MEITEQQYNRNEVEVLRETSIRPLRQWGTKVKIWLAFLILVCGWGLFCFIYQLQHGLGATAMRNYVSWGLYIATFVFFIGISHSGTLVSGILRITKQPWRMPITRSAELMTFVSLLFGGIMPIIDLGRPDRLHHIVLFGRLQSPLIWDVICIGTYFVGSSMFLFLPMIPDMALCRDRLKGTASKFRLWIYEKLSLGWTGTPMQHKRLELTMTIMTIIIIPIAVSVHTVVAYIFAMTLRPGWDSTVFGPYFVAGALYSGSATVILAMAAFRKFYHLEKYITLKHFDLTGRIVLALTLIYAYMNLNEYWIPAYKMAVGEGRLLNDLFSGTYAKVFWILQFGTVLLPIIAMSFPAGRKPLPLIISCIIIVIGAWVKRYIIVVPTLLHPYMPIQEVPWDWAHYFPNWVEWSVTMGCFAGIFLVITLFAKLFPMMAIWEVEEGMKIEETRRLGMEIFKKNESEEAKVATTDGNK